MAKWNPSSKVNANHLLTILRRGDDNYLRYVHEVVQIQADPDQTLAAHTVQNGIDLGYLPTDAKAILFPTAANVEELQIAAAANAQADMVAQLLTDGLDTAVQAMIDNGMLTEELVAAVRADLAG